jgi:S1-C subfamily serine protease
MKITLLLLCIYAFVGVAVIMDERLREEKMVTRRPVPVRAVIPPAKPAPPAGTLLGGPSPEDPEVRFRSGGPRRDSFGTAFPVRKYGWFMTARHVVDDCDRVGIVTERGRIVTVSRLVLSPRADLALMQSRFFPVPLPVERPILRYGQSGFAYGFPGGKWGRVHGLLLGRARIRQGGRDSSFQEALVWSEKAVHPPSIDSLGGMSGGPMLDASGTVIGVHKGGSRRRGRLITVAPINLNAMLANNRLSTEELPGVGFELEGLDEKRATDIGDRLRARGRVALVLCDVSESDGIKGWR